MVLIAFSLQDQVEKYGAYVGIAAFFGLAVLSLLYFAQAREVKRLREWAGRAPERAAELEEAVAAHAQEVQRAATPVPAAQPVPAPVAQPQPVAASANGAVKLKPAEVAALAFARAAGVHEPHEPTPHHVPAAAVAAEQPSQVATAAPPSAAPPPEVTPAPPSEVAAAGAAVASGEPAAAKALNGGGGGVPAPATPAARRAEPAPPAAPAHRAEPALPPLPPRRPAPAPRRAPAPPPRRESNTRAVVLTAIIGVAVLAGAAFGAIRLLGDDDTPPPPNAVGTATPTDSDEATATATAAPAPTKRTALVAVYNGTNVPLLAAGFRDQLKEQGYPSDNLGADTAPAEAQRQTSIVMYRRGAKAAAQGVATALDIQAPVEPFDATTQALIVNAPKKWDVVAIVGADKSP